MKTPLRFAILRFSWCGRTYTSREAGELCEMEEFGCRAFENRSVSRILSPEIRARFRGGDHSSRPSVAGRLKRPTRRRSAPAGATSGGQPCLTTSLFGLAPRGVCLAARVTTRAGALLL